MSFCAKCGSELSDDVMFCPSCGQSLSQVGSGQSNPYATNVPYDTAGYSTVAGSSATMSFGQAVSTCFRKYATFSGRARRKEYWYFILFTFVVAFLLSFLFHVTGLRILEIVASIFHYGVLLPYYAVTARRLHDRGITGWFQLAPQLFIFFGSMLVRIGASHDLAGPALVTATLVCLILAIVMAIILFVRLVRIGEHGDNEYGPDPLRESN